MKLRSTILHNLPPFKPNMQCRHCQKETNSDSIFCSQECKKAHWAKAEDKTTNIPLIQERLKSIAAGLPALKVKPQKEKEDDNWQSTLFMYK